MDAKTCAHHLTYGVYATPSQAGTVVYLRCALCGIPYRVDPVTWAREAQRRADGYRWGLVPGGPDAWGRWDVG